MSNGKIPVYINADVVRVIVGEAEVDIENGMVTVEFFKDASRHSSTLIAKGVVGVFAPGISEGRHRAEEA